MEYIKFKYIEVKQPIGSFYIGKLSWEDLNKIAFGDIRKIEKESNKTDSFDSYLGIQRELSPSRLKEISNYVQTQDATFPTSIILSVNSESIINNKEIDTNLENISTIENIRIDRKNNIILIRNDKNVASILDGQHRIEGLKKFTRNNNKPFEFEFNVTLFVDIDIDDQAQIFSVINKAQTKVNKSLVYDLYEFAKSGSPQKTAHDVVRILNRNKLSPFYKKIKILGVAKERDVETITQSTFAELIIKYISSDPILDRDLIRRKPNKKIRNIGLKNNENMAEKYIFRNYFINEEDEKIIKIIMDYFNAVKKKWPKAWDKGINGSILPKSTGVIALMRLLKDIVNNKKLNWTSSSEDYYILLDKSSLKENDFVKEKFLPGTSGQSELYRVLFKDCLK